MLLKFTPRLSDPYQQECRIPNPPAHLLFCLIIAFGISKKSQSSRTQGPHGHSTFTCPSTEQLLNPAATWGWNVCVCVHVNILIHLWDLSEMQCNSDRWEKRCKTEKAIHSLPCVPNEQSHLVIFLLLDQPKLFMPLPSQLACKNIN